MIIWGNDLPYDIKKGIGELVNKDKFKSNTFGML